MLFRLFAVDKQLEMGALAAEVKMKIFYALIRARSKYNFHCNHATMFLKKVKPQRVDGNWTVHLH